MWSAHLTLLLLPLLAAMTPAPLLPDSIRIASWNLEWLVSPATAHAARLACEAGRRTRLPCDVAWNLARDTADWSRLRHYARELDADVIAFQEVESAEVAQRVFHGYRLCMGADPGLQQVGFAVRSDIPHHCEAPLGDLALDGRSRSGVVMQLMPGTPNALLLLALHLKSGCADAPLDSNSAACRMLDEQGTVLSGWIAARRQEQQSYIVLGDFNRGGPRHEDIFWQRIDAAAGEPLLDAAADTPFRNCYTGQPFTRYIDHILVSPRLREGLVAGSFRKHGYSARDALRYRLSDHCPVSVRFSLNIAAFGPPAPLYRRAD